MAAEYPPPQPLPVEHPTIRRLVGCDYGTVVAVMDDAGMKCDTMAVQRIVLNRSGEKVTVQFCERHLELILHETEPSGGPA